MYRDKCIYTNSGGDNSEASVLKSLSASLMSQMIRDLRFFYRLFLIEINVHVQFNKSVDYFMSDLSLLKLF